MCLSKTLTENLGSNGRISVPLHVGVRRSIRLEKLCFKIKICIMNNTHKKRFRRIDRANPVCHAYGEGLIIAKGMNRHVGESTDGFPQTHRGKRYENRNENWE